MVQHSMLELQTVLHRLLTPQRQTSTDVTECKDMLGGSQEVVESPVKIARLATGLHSILEAALLTAISHGIQRADSIAERTEPQVPNLEQAISVTVAEGPVIAGR
jgi:hypothetical protein